MSISPRRLVRLSRAQSDFAQLLEGRIAAERRRGEELARIRTGTIAALERMSTEGLTFYAAALRRLAELDTAIAGSEVNCRELVARLVAARSRQEALQRKAEALLLVEERKGQVEETTESVVAMQKKGPGKRDVMK